MSSSSCLSHATKPIHGPVYATAKSGTCYPSHGVILLPKSYLEGPGDGSLRVAIGLIVITLVVVLPSCGHLLGVFVGYRDEGTVRTTVMTKTNRDKSSCRQ
jgi:hypothetical protein